MPSSAWKAAFELKHPVLIRDIQSISKLLATLLTLRIEIYMLF